METPQFDNKIPGEKTQKFKIFYNNELIKSGNSNADFIGFKTHMYKTCIYYIDRSNVSAEIFWSELRAAK